MPRPLAVTVAVIIQGVLSAADILLTLPFLSGAALPDDGPPLFINVLTLLIGLLGLVAAWGAWRRKRWGSVSTVVLRALDGLASVPAILFAPSLGLQIGAVVAILLSIAVIWLLLMPAARRVMA